MDDKDNLQKNTFKTYYKSLNKEERKEIRNAFLRESELSYPAFYSKLKHGKFTKLEIKELSRLCKREFSE